MLLSKQSDLILAVRMGWYEKNKNSAGNEFINNVVDS